MVIRLLNPVQPGLRLEGLLAAPCVWAGKVKGSLEPALQGLLRTPELFQPEGQVVWQADTEKLCPFCLERERIKDNKEGERCKGRAKDRNSVWKGKKATEIWERKKDNEDHLKWRKKGESPHCWYCVHTFILTGFLLMSLVPLGTHASMH